MFVTVPFGSRIEREGSKRAMFTAKFRESSALQSLFLALCLSAFSAPASAEPILWTLSGITFGDGATATGSFDYNSDTGLYSAIQITLAGGTLPASLRGTYTYPDICCSGASDPIFLLDVPSANEVGQPVLQLFLNSPMTDAGGVIPLIQALVSTCGNSNCQAFPNPGPPQLLPSGLPSPEITSGEVPEPTTMALFGLGLVALAVLKRRRQTILTRQTPR